MKRNKKIFSVFHRWSALFMILALAWLTVSTPFVCATQQDLVKQHKMENSSSPLSGNEEEASNPLGNNTEEKVPGPGNSFSEEYLHDNHLSHYFISHSSDYHKLENSGTYTAFHGELLVPPPNFS